MKKKILFTVLALFVFLSVTSKVNASVAAKAIESEAAVMVGKTDKLYAITDTPFASYSKINFSVDGSETDTIVGKSSMNKIILSVSPEFGTSVFGLTPDKVLGDYWFTAYCLDGSLSYPNFSLYNYNPKLYLSLNNESIPATKKIATLAALGMYNNSEFHNALNSVIGYKYMDLSGTGSPDDKYIDYTFEDGTLTTAEGAEAKAQELLGKFITGEKITVVVKSLTFRPFDGDDVTKTIADLTGDASKTTYTLTFDAKDVFYDLYTSTALTADKYDHALWIIEHTYPSLSLKDALTAAGANYDLLLQEIKALETGKTDEEIAALAEEYVYATIQYAIWKANGLDFEGKKLGDSIKTEGQTQLNTLYKYLIQDRSEYSGYSERSYTKSLTFDKSAEKVEDKKDYYLYGPYTINDSDGTNKMMSVSDINVEITNSDKTGISIVDESGKVLTSVASGQAFYIKCTKAGKIANVSLKYSATGQGFVRSETNKGKVYYANFPFAQNLLTGGKIETITAEGNEELIYNPKTGVENIAVIFVITLVAFSLGYLVLSYKNQPMSLN